MYQSTEHIIALSKAQFETAARLAGIALQGAERIVNLQMEAAKAAVADGIENAKAFASVKSAQELAALKDNVAQPSLERAVAYAKNACDAALQTQSQLSQVVEQQIGEVNRHVVALVEDAVKNAPPGSEAAIAALKSGIAAVNAGYDNFAKMARQFTDTAQANCEFATTQAANEAKKSKKAA